MDIHSLLSPDDGAHYATAATAAAAAASPSPAPGRSAQAAAPPTSPSRARPTLAGGKRIPSTLSQEITRSPPDRAIDSAAAPPATSRPSHSHTTSQPGTPQQREQYPDHHHHHHHHHHHQHAFYAQPAAGSAPDFRPLPPTSNPAPGPDSPAHQQHALAQQQQRPAVAHRPLSTPQMETLADLASLQQRQQTTRTYSANSIRPADAQRAPLTAPPVARTISRQSLADLTMAEAPAQTPPPRDFVSTALSDVESKTVNDLLNYLAENSYAYDQHLQLISLLHKGFLAHTYPPADGEPSSSPPGDPRSYALLTEMRQARDAMDTRFAVGEDIWADWLSDEMMLARASDERLAVTELCQRAVQDEPSSTKLWNLYVDWVASNYADCWDLEGATQQNWTAEDKEMCKELFSRETLLNVLEQAVSATQWRVDDSHIIWNRYAQIIQESIPSHPTDNDKQHLHALFIRRLQTPHLARDETMQIYWPIISRFEGNSYEAAIDDVNRLAEPAKVHTDIRGEHELKIQRAMQGGDLDNIRREFEKYLKSEKFHHKNPGPFDYDLRCGLFERALLRFPTATDWWLDYIDFVVTSDPVGSRHLLPLVERATRHCPWSGDLWARRILRADVERQSREEIENTKHRATNAGLLDVGGMEELVKMLQQWCSYLRRHAFNPAASEDDADTAEVGIIGALEDVSQAGKKLYGDGFQGDPLFRLEKIQIKFYSEARRFDDARAIYRQLIPLQAKSHDFWAAYYNWELWLWGYDRIRDARRVETHDNGPDLASRVCQEALKQRDLDWPEKTLEMYLAHFQQHESEVRLQEALADARDFSTRLATRRGKEAEVAAQQQQEQHAVPAEAAESTVVAAGEKRKREDELVTNGDVHKRAKIEGAEEHREPSASASAQAKRDREHNTITLKSLPANVQEVDIRKFFRDVGNPKSINILRDEGSDSASATVEFETHEDVLAAKTRDGKTLRGHEVQIVSVGQNTLYVTNYPAEYDENAIRSLFKSYGEIVGVRFPSLKYNSRRRFSYVQFLTAEMAKAAEAAMDGKKLDGLHILEAKISDPEAKKKRSSAQLEGREIIVKNLDREASEKEIREIFSHYGRLEKVNLLKLVNGKYTGTGFFIYPTAEEATAAVEGANNKPFRDRILHVALSNPKGGAAPHEKALREDHIVKKTNTGSPKPNNARRGSDVSMRSGPAAPGQEDEGYKTARERKIAIFNLPDTVNDARIRTAMEAIGPITKIQLRRERKGAIVEFETVKDAFKVRMGIDVGSLGPDVTTGDVGDLLAKKKQSRAAAAASNGTGTGSALAFVPAAAARPGQARGGRRGGLGLKRGGAGSAAPGFGRPAAPAGEDAGSSKKKSNNDFRTMLEASKKAAPAMPSQKEFQGDGGGGGEQDESVVDR